MDAFFKRRERNAGRERPRDPERDRDRDGNRPAVRAPSSSHDEHRTKSTRHDGDDRRPRNPAHDRPHAARNRLTGAKAVARARAHLHDLTGRHPEGVSALSRTQDGWRVVIEVVELERIPQTTDILASYAVDLDGEGELMGYERINRYYRSDVNGDQ